MLELLLVVLGGLYKVLGIESKLVVCRVNTLSIILSFQLGSPGKS